MSKVFINYRRTDSGAVATGLNIQLGSVFGAENVFMDSFSIDMGEEWPDCLDDAIRNASVVLVVIGNKWLTMADKYGYRMLDKPNDWVRLEIEKALEYNKVVIPVLVDGAELPPLEGLPSSIAIIRNYQKIDLREQTWKADIEPLIRRLEDILPIVGNKNRIEYPSYCDHVSRILQKDEIDKYLSELSNWEIMQSKLPEAPQKKRRELTRTFKFTSFPDAINFMSSAVEHIEKVNHHPRWENIWINVTIYLSTWNIGHDISILDFELATYLESLYQERFRE